MNGLSWLIYLAAVVPNIGVLGVIASIVLGIAGLTGGIVGSVEERATPWRSLTLGAVTCGLVAALLPNERAIYMIAASEVGQKVYEQPATKEMLGDLEDIIRDKLKALKAEVKK